MKKPFLLLMREKLASEKRCTALTAPVSPRSASAPMRGEEVVLYLSAPRILLQAPSRKQVQNLPGHPLCGYPHPCC